MRRRASRRRCTTRLRPCSKCRLLIEVAQKLDVPVLAAEQYPEGLGPTVAELAALLNPAQVYAKRRFSCAREPRIVAALDRLARTEIVICGMEAHICILQGALGLQARGLRTIVVADAVASRRAASRDHALERMRGHGVEIVTAEMVVYEWLREAATPEFRAILPLVR